MIFFFINDYNNLKDQNINILGLNTQLHHERFDRKAGKGYRWNHIHCHCSAQDLESLRDKISKFKNSEFIGGKIAHVQYNGG